MTSAMGFINILTSEIKCAGFWRSEENSITASRIAFREDLVLEEPEML